MNAPRLDAVRDRFRRYAPSYSTPTQETTPMVRLSLMFVAALLIGSSTADAEDAAARYDKVRQIKLGGEGRWDFLEVDVPNRRLYVSRETRVVIIDLDTEKVVGEIPDTPGVHGIAFVHALN